MTRWGRKIKPLVYIYDSSNLKPGSAVELCSNEKAWVFNSTVLLMKKTDISTDIVKLSVLNKIRKTNVNSLANR